MNSHLDPHLDDTTPNLSRIYDFVLGGSANFAADRRAAKDMLSTWPGEQAYARINRAFLRRAVTVLSAAGIDQFLDLGSGIPTVGNVHEVAAAVRPGTRVAYVDIDPVAVEHSRLLLREDERDAVTSTLADVREPDTVLSAPGVAGLLDFSRPVAVLAVAILDILDTPDPGALLAAYRDVCAPGSALAMSNAQQMDISDDELAAVRAIQAQTTTPTLRLRTADELATLFAGYDLLSPGVVPSAAWRPEHPVTEEEAARSNSNAAAGILRG
jgi:hypothetical protein